jgi:hypothetical protein
MILDAPKRFISEDDEVFAQLWEHYSPLLIKSLNRCADGTWGIDDVKQAVMDGQMQFWHTDGAVVVTEILEFPRKKALNCWLVGGTIPDLAKLYDSLEAFAKANGCYAMYASGRKGWHKVLDAYGWHQDYHMCKFLEA